MKSIITLFILLIVPARIFACSFAPTLEHFQYSNEYSEIPNKPNFVLESISRGFKNGNNCGGFATFILSTVDEEKDVGYFFSFANGEVGDLEFSKEAIVQIKNNSNADKYIFIWFDGYSNKQEEIDATLKIIAVSKNHQLSEPQYLKISHPGVKVPWWKFW